jgi:hypothetical protein
MTTAAAAIAIGFVGEAAVALVAFAPAQTQQSGGMIHGDPGLARGPAAVTPADDAGELTPLGLAKKAAALAPAPASTPAPPAAPAPEPNACAHDDYRQTRAFNGEVRACMNERIEIAASLAVFPTGDAGRIVIPGTSGIILSTSGVPGGVWRAELSGLERDQIEYLRSHCESDLPCTAHFKLTLLEPRDVPALQPGERREGWVICSNGYSGTSCKSASPTAVRATLDGWR